MMNAEPKTRAPRSSRLSSVIQHSSFSILFGVLALAGCERNDMHNQPRHEPMEPSTFFPDGQSSRQMVPGTVARGQLVSNDMRYGGLPSGPTPETFPFEITKSDLNRGKQRFEIYCGVCHGATGDGDGMIVQRGFVKPPSFHEQRLKDAPVGHFFDVITNGWGAMYSYNDRIFPEDRWRIAAYIRVLQLSQNDALAAAPQAMRAPGGGGEAGTLRTPAGPDAHAAPHAPPPQPANPPAADPVKGAVDDVTGPAQQQQPDQQPQQPQQPPSGGQPGQTGAPQ